MRNRKPVAALVLLAAASVLAAAPAPRQTANVVLVTTDGLRWQEVFTGAEERLPVIAREGQLYGNAARGSWARVTNGLNFSYPGCNELLTGAADPRIDSNDKRPNPNVTVLEWLNGREGYRGRVAAFCSWDVFPPASGERANVEAITQAQVAATVAALLGEDYRAGAPSSAPPIKGAVKELR